MLAAICSALGMRLPDIHLLVIELEADSGIAYRHHEKLSEDDSLFSPAAT